MKLDRNINPNGAGKYALIKLRAVGERWFNELLEKRSGNTLGLDIPVAICAIDLGDSPDTDFFVIRLRDKHAAPALAAYALSAFRDDPEFGLQVLNMAKRAAEYPHPQHPD